MTEQPTKRGGAYDDPIYKGLYFEREVLTKLTELVETHGIGSVNRMINEALKNQLGLPIPPAFKQFLDGAGAK